MTPQQEWSDPKNWSHGLAGIYFAKGDPRLWVAKRNPAMGWTLNMAHPKAGLWLFGIILFSALLPALILLVVMTRA